MNELKIKKIVSLFLRVKPNEITGETIIDTSVLQGSILYSRMISKVNAVSQTDLDGLNIRTFSDLLDAIKKDS
jgi:hypothetical protein